MKEQHDLHGYPDSQINIVKIDGKDALVNCEIQIMARSHQGSHILFVLVFALTALLNYIESICFLDLLEVIFGQNAMFKLTLSSSRGQIIGIPINQLAKHTGQVHSKL